MKKITVLFQGDSVTDCGRATCGGAGYSNGGMGPGYPGMIASRLLCDHPEIEWNFINRGISGNRIVDLYARWKRDAVNLNPDIISILIGINDTWHEKNMDGVEVDRYSRIYHELLSWTRERLPNVRFVLMDPFGFDRGQKEKTDFINDVGERRKIVAQLAKEFNAVHIPLQDLLNEAYKRAPEEYWTVDGVHPTPAGHQLITDAWIKASGKLLGIS